MSPDVDAVMVICRDDRASLRVALVVEGLRLIVTIYNRDLGAQLRRAVRNVRVMSMADIVAPSLAAACLSDDLLSVGRLGDRVLGIRPGADGPATAPLAVHRPNPGERLLTNLTSLLHPFELSAKTLLSGLLGFVLILVTDSFVVSLALHDRHHGSQRRGRRRASLAEALFRGDDARRAGLRRRLHRRSHRPTAGPSPRRDPRPARDAAQRTAPSSWASGRSGCGCA
jgi:hypothetical protein